MHPRLQVNVLRPRIAEAHGDMDPPSRHVTDPGEELLRLENFERYRQQSSASRDGEVAPLPPRSRLYLVSKD
jgi:hypothetical protein